MSPNVSVRNIGGLNVPQHDHVALSYVGATNNLDQVVYRVGGAAGRIVCRLTMGYAGGVPSSDDAALVSVTRAEA